MPQRRPVGCAPTTSYITSKVKARFVEANKFSATHVKVVTERGVVYLMGIVTRDEADARRQIASHHVGRRARRQAVRDNQLAARAPVASCRAMSASAVPLPEPRYPAKIVDTRI